MKAEDLNNLLKVLFSFLNFEDAVSLFFGLQIRPPSQFNLQPNHQIVPSYRV